MPSYRRWFRPGGMYFFTLVTAHRAPFLCTDLTRPILRDVLRIVQESRPFAIDAIVLLPDHIHMLMTLPPGDDDFATRLASIKAQFTRRYLDAGGREHFQSVSRDRRGHRGVWQRRFWEHLIRDELDLERHVNYIHYNPIKHGLCECAHGWPYSTFAKWVKKGIYPTTWQCRCGGPVPDPPDFDSVDVGCDSSHHSFGE